MAKGSPPAYHKTKEKQPETKERTFQLPVLKQSLLICFD